MMSIWKVKAATIMEILYKVIILIALFSLAAVTYYYIIPLIKSKTTKAQREEIVAQATVFVKAAEQIIKGTKMGAERFAKVMKWFEESGFKVNEPKIKALIEAAIEKTVYDFIND